MTMSFTSPIQASKFKKHQSCLPSTQMWKVSLAVYWTADVTLSSVGKYESKSININIHEHVFMSNSLMATSKPGNRGLHRAGWLSPARPTADVGGKDFFFLFSKAVCVQLVMCWRVHCCTHKEQTAICKHLSHSNRIYWVFQSETILWNVKEHGADYRLGAGRQRLNVCCRKSYRCGQLWCSRQQELVFKTAISINFLKKKM